VIQGINRAAYQQRQHSSIELDQSNDDDARDHYAKRQHDDLLESLIGVHQ